MFVQLHGDVSEAFQSCTAERLPVNPFLKSSKAKPSEVSAADMSKRVAETISQRPIFIIALILVQSSRKFKKVQESSRKLPAFHMMMCVKDDVPR
jgi:hypothetical protein